MKRKQKRKLTFLHNIQRQLRLAAGRRDKSRKISIFEGKSTKKTNKRKRNVNNRKEPERKKWGLKEKGDVSTEHSEIYIIGSCKERQKPKDFHIRREDDEKGVTKKREKRKKKKAERKKRKGKQKGDVSKEYPETNIFVSCKERQKPKDLDIRREDDENEVTKEKEKEKGQQKKK